MRSGSGVTPLTLFTKMWDCGGACIYCPSVPETPKSYLSRTNFTKISKNYSSYDQTKYWLNKIADRGGTCSKLEIIILGGSFTALPSYYIETFLSGVFHAVEEVREGTYPLQTIINKHESSSSPKIVGITVETRPDLINDKQIQLLYKYGITKIELGIQHLNDDILLYNNRKQNIVQVHNSVKIIKDIGLKVGFHILLGMPKSSLDKDEIIFDQLFSDNLLQPDHLKLYFCEYFKKEFMHPKMIELVERKKWNPLDLKERYSLLSKILPKIPKTVRISRIGRKVTRRDLETKPIDVKRDYIEQKVACKCIRCREPIRTKNRINNQVNLDFVLICNNELYIEATDNSNTCYGVLRLRQLQNNEAVVRELHVYGEEAKIGTKGNVQHKGIGFLLLDRAEKKAIELWHSESIKVASGIGTRTYYKNRGYRKNKSGYMIKRLK